MWEKVDKQKLVQYKLKVDLTADVTKVIETAGGQQPTASADTMDKLTGAVKDKMLVDHRDRPEESKEKPDMQRFTKPGSL